ncbi:MAG: hypothetical protein IKP58_12200 [Victivallales bacterium]|nr:hypothetical protein [Victivallales bacterium]MBR6058919.1 hypothetical protein [Victivallales bacterium]
METTKLTLHPSKTIAELARQMASEEHVSITQLFSAFILARIQIKHNMKTIPIGPLTRSATGLLKVPENWDYKKDMEDILEEKLEIGHENLP